MSKSKGETGHALLIDTGTNLYHLNTPHRFDLEKWLEAILCSMQTARETKLSMTGRCRNISRTIQLYDQDQDKTRESIRTNANKVLPQTSRYEDVDQLLEICTQMKDDLITTIDACMAQ
jgi:hypothetical protein